MSTLINQRCCITKAEYKMLFEACTASIHDLESVLADETITEPVSEFVVNRLEAWQTLLEKIRTKI